MENWIIDERLKKAIQENELIIFAGAGVAKSIGLPDWPEFITEILGQLSVNDSDCKSHIESIKEKKASAIKIFNSIEKKHKPFVRTYVANRFRVPDEKELHLHQNIIKLTSKIVTTNYDNAFEIAYRQLYGGFFPYVGIQNIDKFNSAMIMKAPKFILKLHGCTFSPDSCAVFTSDYKKIYTKESASVKIIEMLFTTKVILFIGFSFSDKEINYIFNNMFKIFGDNYRHFVLTENPDVFSKIEFLEPIKISHDKINDFLIQCIQLKKLIKIVKSESEILVTCNMLSQIELFKNISQDQIKLIVQRSDFYNLTRNEVLCEKDDEITSFWLILSGSIAAIKDNVITTVRKKNSIIGELGLLEGRKLRSSKLIAHEFGTEILEIKLDLIQGLQSESQALIWKNLASMLGAKIEKLDSFLCVLEQNIDKFRQEDYENE